MKAIQFVGSNQLVVNEVPMPKVPNGWGLIKVSNAGICGTDLNIYAGTHPRAKAPLTMGHEFSGVMAEDAEGFPKGTRVTVYPLISCGNCTPCKTGNKHVCNTLGLFGIDCDGGMAEYVAIPCENIIKLPEHISDKLGAFIEPIAVAVHTLRERNYTPGDNAIVFGGGTIGLCIATTLRNFGCKNLILAEVDATRRAAAENMGFCTVNPAGVDMLQYAAEKTNGDGFDWVFDCAGVQPVADLLLDMVKVKGKIIVVASYKKAPALPLFKGMAKETSIEFVRVYRKEDFETAARLAADDETYDKIITHVLDYSDAQKGFDLLTTPGTGAIKVIFQF